MRTRIALGTAIAASTIFSMTMYAASGAAAASSRAAGAPTSPAGATVSKVGSPAHAAGPVHGLTLGAIVTRTAGGASARFLTDAVPEHRSDHRRNLAADVSHLTLSVTVKVTSLSTLLRPVLAAAAARREAASPPPPPPPPAVAAAAAPAPPPPPPPPPPTDATSTDTFDWACIRDHESNDRYNTPDAPSGAYGILDSTWHSLGYTGWPYEAPEWMQDEAALRLYNEYGWQPWSTRWVCGL